MFQPSTKPMPRGDHTGCPQPRPEWFVNHRNNYSNLCEERLEMQKKAMAYAYTPKRNGFWGAIEDMLNPQLPVVEIIQIDALEQLLLVPWARWDNLSSRNVLSAPSFHNDNWLNDAPMQFTQYQESTLGTLILNRDRINAGMFLSGGLFVGMLMMLVFFLAFSIFIDIYDILPFIMMILLSSVIFVVSFYYSKQKYWIDVSKDYLIIDCSIHHNGKRKVFLRNPRDTMVDYTPSHVKDANGRLYNVYLTNGKTRAKIGLLKFEKIFMLKTMIDTLLMAKL